MSYRANNCEIFIDKVSANDSDVDTITLYAKTTNDRLDGAIAEVGFRDERTVTGIPDDVGASFQDTKFSAFDNAGDYFQLTLEIEDHEAGGTVTHTGAFYVKTVKDTYFWLNPASAQNYVLDYNAWNDINNKTPLNDKLNANGPATALPTQSADFKYYNPEGCE